MNFALTVNDFTACSSATSESKAFSASPAVCKKPFCTNVHTIIVTPRSARVIDISEESSYMSSQISRDEILRELDEIYLESVQTGLTDQNQPAKALSYSNAKYFIASIPETNTWPSIGLDPDGEVSLDWSNHRDSMFSISFAENGSIHYAGVFGFNEHHGKTLMLGKIPTDILRFINRVI